MYIEREAALTALSMSVANAEYDECEEETVKKCMGVLHKVPAADVAPVVHSSWEITDVDHGHGHKCYHCPECGEDEWRYDEPKYCPNCGAKMNGGKNYVRETEKETHQVSDPH